MSIRDLEERAHLKKSKVSRSISRLENCAIVEKLQSDKDQRLVVIQLRPKEHKLFLEIVPQARAFNERLKVKLKEGGQTLLQELERLSEG